MWIENEPSGKFKYRETYTDPLTGKNKTTSLTYTKKATRGSKLWNEMAMKLQQKIDDKLSEYNANSDNLTLRELLENWLVGYEETVKRSTYLRTITNVKTLNKHLGDYLVEKLEAYHFNRFYDKLLTDKTHKYASVQQIHSIVKRVMIHAYKYYGIDKSELSRLLEVPNKNVSKKDEYKFLERHELKQVINYLENKDKLMYARMVQIMANCGMRYGELVSVDYKEDINFQDNSMVIRKTYNFDTNEFTSTKTDRERIIYFSDGVAKTIKKQMQHSQLRTIKHNLNRETNLLFTSVNGRPPLITDFNRWLGRVPGIDKRITTHIFRHTFISLAIEQGMSKELIQQQVGHVDNKMIDTIYSHVTAGRTEQQKKAMLDFKIV
ncbi:site-specific integrase [Aerococcaceae bacterium DSM 111022]|nr:site-specific integrase [Aerococcaceae bacterium DSM 111022]